MRLGMAIVPLVLLGGCMEGRSSMSLPPAPTVAVTAVAETEAVATRDADAADDPAIWRNADDPQASLIVRSEEHTSELQSLMRISYAVFCLKTKSNSMK